MGYDHAVARARATRSNSEMKRNGPKSNGEKKRNDNRIIRHKCQARMCGQARREIVAADHAGYTVVMWIPRSSTRVSDANEMRYLNGSSPATVGWLVGTPPTGWNDISACSDTHSLSTLCHTSAGFALPSVPWRGVVLHTLVPRCLRDRPCGSSFMRCKR